MDIDDIRRANIRSAEDEIGSATVFAERAGMSYAQYINLRDGAKDSKTGKPRGMRKATAWKLEDAAKKPRGWLDVDHSGRNLAGEPKNDQYLSNVTKLNRALSAELRTIEKLLTSTDAGGRALAVAAVKLALTQYHPVKAKLRK